MTAVFLLDRLLLLWHVSRISGKLFYVKNTQNILMK